MQSEVFSWHSLYLRWAGLVSACLGLLSAALLLISFGEDAANIKLIEAVSGIFGILLSYAIGRDILDRVRNREETAGLITNIQARLAFVGTRFPFVLVGLIVLLLLGTLVFFSLHPLERTAFFCSSGRGIDFWHCVYEFTGFRYGE